MAATAYQATYRHARISARKVRALANLIRGKHADEALDLLRYQPQRSVPAFAARARSRTGAYDGFGVQSAHNRPDCQPETHRHGGSG